MSPYTTLAYDSLDRLTSLTKPSSDGNHSLTYAYDDAGRQTSVSVASPYLSWSADYEYDSRSLVSKVTENRFAKKSWYLQNEAGQTVKSYSEDNSGGFSSFYKYNAGGLLTEVLIQNSSGQATTLLRYTYNQNGNVTRVDDDLAGRWVLYTYDELDRLTQEEYWTAGNGSPDTTIQYGYDALGNRTSVTRDGVTTTYSYNAEKNRLTAVGGVSYQYDSAGNLTSDGANTYAWDNANRLKQVQAGANTYSFTYDALGRRVSKTVNGTTEYYHYDGDRVAYVTNASGLILRIFTYDGSGRPIYLHQNGTLYQYHYNGHGDVIKLTDMNQAVVAEYKYDAWGNITSKTGSLADSNPYRYAGYWYDKEIGLYYLNSRYYKPDVGRFVSQDTYKGNPWQPSTQNLYVYVGNNPVNYVDPTGHRADAGAGCGVAIEGAQASDVNNAENDEDLTGAGTWIDLGGGWKARKDPPNSNAPGAQPHVHVYDPKGNEVGSWNKDGTIHDKHKARNDKVPKGVKEKVQEKTGYQPPKMIEVELPQFHPAPLMNPAPVVAPVGVTLLLMWELLAHRTLVP